MNSLRGIFLGVVTALLVSFALPASAVDKTYSLNVSPSVPAGATSATISATFTNATPSGNSSFNSLTLGVTGGGLSIIGAAVPNGVISPVPSVGSPLQTINVTNMSPVKPNKTFTVTLTVKTNAASGCAAATANWTATTWTGSSLSGENFAFQSGSSNVNTNVTAACSLVFTTQPKNALSGGLVGGPVAIQGSPAGAFVGSTVTLTTTSGTPTLSGNTAIVSAAGVAQFPNLSITGAGTYALLATSSVSGAPTATSTSFVVGASDGFLECEDDSAHELPSAFGTVSTGGKRGKFNKDGRLCIPVAYDFQNNVAANNSARLIWDTVSQNNAAFEIWVDWQPELVAGDGLPAKTTYVTWKFDPITGLPTNKQPGRACVGDSLPQSYGTLTGYTPGTPDKISIGGTFPSAYAFAISIGDGTTTERLLVTGAASGGYNVLRAQGGTTAVNLASLVGTALVMSNPLPLDSSTPVPLQMQMCIAEEVWMSLPPGSAGCPANPQGIACIQNRSRIFDVGDGFINRDL